MPFVWLNLTLPFSHNTAYSLDFLESSKLPKAGSDPTYQVERGKYFFLFVQLGILLPMLDVPEESK